MSLISVTQSSSANTEQTVTLSVPSGKKMFIKKYSVSTKGGDIAADVNIVINDNAVPIWADALRSAVVFAVTQDFPDFGLPIRAGDCTIVIDDAGDSVVTVASVLYEVV